jgi:hypothetical protein
MNRTPLRAVREVTERNYARTLLATLLSVAWAFSALAARGQTFTTPVNISSDGAGSASQLVVDSSGNIDIAYAVRAATNTAGGIRFVRSSDGGRTFSKPVDIALSDASYFSMALESGCVIDVTYFQSGDVFVSQSSDCGKTFAPTNVTKSNGTLGPVQSIQMTANHGVAQIAWVGSDLKLYYAQRNPDGTFTVPVVLFAQGEGSIGLSAMALSNGTTEMVWAAGEFTCQLYFLNSFNGALPAQVLPRDEDLCGTVPFVVDPAGNVNITWRAFDLNGSHVVRFVRSAGQNGNFAAPKSISDGSDPQIAADASGKIVLAWASGADIAFSDSTDGGNTFSAPMNVAVAPNGSSVFGPQLALPGDSSVAIAWSQGPASGQGSDLWFSESSNNGSTFSTPVNITKNQSAPSAVRMVTDPAGNILMVWSGNVSNGQDIFFARSAAVTGGFTINAEPASLAAMPGGSATAQVTLTVTGGFDQAVNLSCGNLPQGAACSFNPATVTPSTSGTFVTLTLTIPATLPAGSFPFTVNAATPTISQFQNMQINVGLLTGSVTPAATTIPLGGTANFVVTVIGTGSFAGQFSLACNAPAGVACTFSPNSGFLPINGRATSTLTVQILSLPATGSALKDPRDVFPPSPPKAQDLLPFSALALLLLGVLAFAFSRRREGDRLPLARTMACLVLTAVLAAAMLSCGGSTTKGVFSTSGAGTAGTSGTTTAGTTSVTFPLTVMAQSGGAFVNVGTVSVTVP